ncbi:MAG: peptidoglycan-binding protein [Oscillospiraceae bacterium]|nr:peptidoglycan-binding protein [Oscillospiraceae bacterium]
MAFSDFQRSEHISEIQRYLHDISYFDAGIPRIVPDSIYGEETAQAVRSFQQRYGLLVNGEVNPATWERIVEVYLRLAGTPALPLEVFPREVGRILDTGDEGFAVLVLQAILLSLTQRFPNLPKVAITGKYSEETATAVTAFQELSGLPPTGFVDRPTWNVLAAAAAAELNR